MHRECRRFSITWFHQSASQLTMKSFMKFQFIFINLSFQHLWDFNCFLGYCYVCHPIGRKREFVFCASEYYGDPLINRVPARRVLLAQDGDALLEKIMMSNMILTLLFHKHTLSFGTYRQILPTSKASQIHFHLLWLGFHQEHGKDFQAFHL